MKKREMVDAIVDREWLQFTNTINIGQRSYCQDQKSSFYLSRKAYLNIYDEEILSSYLSDLETAERKGIHLVTQKYAYMMESTDIENFNKIKDQILPLSDKKSNIVESIMYIYVQWLKELEQSEGDKGSRPLFSTSDSVNSTSAETYMRGELKSYSDMTLVKILGFFLSHAGLGNNLVLQNLEKLKQND